MHLARLFSALAGVVCFAALAIGTMSPAKAGTVTIATNDGTAIFSSSDYVNGFGTVGDANYIASWLASYDVQGANVTMRLTMGAIVDYFRPKTGETLLSMLTANSKHLWSATETGTFVAPSPFVEHLGGSGQFWPAGNVAGDNRTYLSFWGSNSGRTGGCCTTANDAVASWGQAFTLEAITPASTPVPLPAGLPLMGLGLAAFAVMRRAKSPTSTAG